MFSFILKWLPSLLKYAPVLIIAFVVGWLYLQNQSLEQNVSELTQKAEQLQKNNLQLRFSIETMAESYARQSQRLSNLTDDLSYIQEDTSRLNQELEGFKQREEIVIQKPSLVERRANDAYDSLLHDYKCATDPKCSDTSRSD